MDTSLSITPIGIVRSPYTHRDHTPRAATQDTAPAWVDLLPQVADAAREIVPGDSIILLTWLHQANRSVLRCHPMADPSIPERGVFLTRSPDRPNPIGIHPVTVLRRQDLSLLVHPLEALDGTLVLDIKNADRPGRTPFSPHQAMVDVGRNGWVQGLFPGTSGNISLRLADTILITATGTAKGHLTPHSFAVVDLQTGVSLSGTPSSETATHLEIYRSQPHAMAIVHTHPPRLTALMLSGGSLNLPLFEAQRMSLQIVPALPPGSQELAQEAAHAACTTQTLFLAHHGLVCWGKTLEEAMALTEEMEHLAHVAVNLRRNS